MIILTELLSTANEILTAAIVIVAASLLLYNLTRNLSDRVARTSSVVLGCLTVVYISDTFLTLGPGRMTYVSVLRLSWIGIAFMPVAMYHLSDALLATTGLPSRGRRRRIIRILYGIASGFLLLAALTNVLIDPVIVASPIDSGTNIVTLQAGPIFLLYCVYFVITTGAALFNVQRARVRCIARSTRRRMGYLQIALITPAIGIFPFSLLLAVGAEQSLLGLTLVNIANIVVILMLIFLAYPLSFFGSRVPDRIVKVELLRFLLRGPGTGLVALGTIILTVSASRVFGLPGITFMPFAVVAVVLLWQWSVALALPRLERWLVYPAEDADQIAKLEGLSDRLLTRGDLRQLLEAILASVCDYLRVSTAFAIEVHDPTHPEMAGSQGPMLPDPHTLVDAVPLLERASPEWDATQPLMPIAWNGFWIVPLYGGRGDAALLGILGVQARAQTVDLTQDELKKLTTFARRASQTLDDLALQEELFASLEGLLPQVAFTRSRAATLEYRPGRPVQPQPSGIQNGTTNGENGIDAEQWEDQVRAALRHYWGGPGLTSSRLLDTALVRAAMPDNDENPVKALRAVIGQALETMKPDGARKTLAPEWTLYNIVELRYIQQSTVREVSQKLAIGESDLYRKQRTAINQLAKTLLDMEVRLHRK